MSPHFCPSDPDLDFVLFLLVSLTPEVTKNVKDKTTPEKKKAAAATKRPKSPTVHDEESDRSVSSPSPKSSRREKLVTPPSMPQSESEPDKTPSPLRLPSVQDLIKSPSPRKSPARPKSPVETRKKVHSVEDYQEDMTKQDERAQHLLSAFDDDD